MARPRLIPFTDAVAALEELGFLVATTGRPHRVDMDYAARQYIVVPDHYVRPAHRQIIAWLGTGPARMRAA